MKWCGSLGGRGRYPEHMDFTGISVSVETLSNNGRTFDFPNVRLRAKQPLLGRTLTLSLPKPLLSAAFSALSFVEILLLLLLEISLLHLNNNGSNDNELGFSFKSFLK